MTLYAKNSAAIVALDAINDLMDAGAGAGLVRIYDGTPPADADAALAGNTLLAELVGSDPFFLGATQVGNTAEADADTIADDDTPAANGTASFCRLVDSDGNVVYQGDVGTSNAFLIVNTTTVQTTVPFTITGLTVRLPEVAS